MNRLSKPRFLCLLLLLWVLCCSAVPAQPPALVRFAVIGDSGTGDEHQVAIAQQMLAWHDRLPFDLVLMLGDNIYGGSLGTGGGGAKDFAEKFDRPYAALLARGVIFRAALGNHDMRHRGGRALIESVERFHIAGPLGYYSFTVGADSSPLAPSRVGPAAGSQAPLVEFFVINTVRLEEDKQDAEQLAWLEQALGSSRARWRILYGHHALYSTGKRHGGDVKLRAKVAPLLLGAKGAPRVHAVLAGHDHIYQRFAPQQGVAHFVCGSSGKLRRGNARPSPLVAAVEDQQRAFMLWEATPDALSFRAINERGQAFDCGHLTSPGIVAATPCD